MNIIEKIKSKFQKEQAPSQEVLDWASSYYLKSQQRPYNADSLVLKKGSVGIYRTMMEDYQVKASIGMKINSIIGDGFNINQANDQNNAEEHRDFIEYCFNDGMQGNMITAIRGMLSSLIFGFSVTEKILELEKIGKFKGKFKIKKLKLRPAETFEFNVDRHGNLESILQHGDEEDIKVSGEDLKSLILYSYNGDNTDSENYFGQSDLRAVYTPYISKKYIINFLNVYLERFGTGMVVLKYPWQNITTDQKTKLQNIVKNISSKTSLLLQKDMEVSTLEQSKSSQSEFTSAIEMYDKRIIRGVLIPDLLGYSDNTGGSYKLGETQSDVFVKILKNIRAELEEIINEQLIKPLIDMNYPNVSNYPYFEFKAIDNRNKNDLMNLYIQAVEKGIISKTTDDENVMREFLDMPLATDENKIEEEPEEEPIDDDSFPFTYEFKPFRELTEYEKKVDFARISQETQTQEMKAVVNMSKIVNKIKDDIIGKIVKKDVVMEENFKGVSKIEIKYVSEMKSTIKDYMKLSYTNAEKEAKKEIKDKKKSFAKNDGRLSSLPPKKAMEYLEVKAFSIAGNEAGFIKSGVESILLDGMKIGRTNAEVVYSLEEFFDKYTVLQKMPNGEMQPVEKISGRLNTMVRTSYSNAYNLGRMEVFDDPDVREIIGAYQYSAIMDNRTSDICLSLDRKIFKYNDPAIKEYTPPNHYNCRSLFVPIFNDEKYKVSKPVKVDLPVGFGGK